MHKEIPLEWLRALALIQRPDAFITTEAQTAGHPYAEILRAALRAGVAGILAVAGVPSAAIVYLPEESGKEASEELRNIYKMLWNQGTLDYLLVIRTKIVSLHSLWVSPDAALMDISGPHKSPTLIDDFELLAKASALEEIITGIESGRFFATHKKQFVPEDRIDTILVGDLIAIRDRLLLESNSPEAISQVHEALLQVIFLRYLWDRGILTPAYLIEYGEGNIFTLHDLLLHSPTGFTRLLAQLEQDLNGSLFTPENPFWHNSASVLSQFIEGLTSFGKAPGQDQGRLISLYQFQHIPVELLSEIYDRFLDEEGDRKSAGAFYTPRRLAALVIDQVWEDLQEVLGQGRMPLVLDPACGSGVFLATLFQRIAEYQDEPDWEDLKHIAWCLHGMDISETAVRISTFSLSLALLGKREPREIEKHMRGQGKVLPQLWGSTLVPGDFFGLDSSDRQYDCIIGNPPWGKARGADTSGELWCKSPQRNCPTIPNRERSWPFLWKAPYHLRSGGLIAFLLPSTGFFINKLARQSLTAFLESWRIERLIDLTDLRNTLFTHAKLPGCIARIAKEKPSIPYRFEYICPKADLNSARADRILLSPDDTHYIFSHVFSGNASVVSQRIMWASSAEQRILAYIDTMSKLKDLFVDQPFKRSRDNAEDVWGIGLGFQLNNDSVSEEDRESFSRHAHLPCLKTSDFSPWVQPPVNSFCSCDIESVAWLNYTNGFYAPHIVFPRSVSKKYKKHLSVTYSEYDFCFNDSTLGIHIPNSDHDRITGKFLTAFLNSKFMAWFMGISTSLGSDRERFLPTTIIELPFPMPNELPDQLTAANIQLEIAQKIDMLFERVKCKEIISSQENFPPVSDKNSINKLIYAYLGLKEYEEAIIEEHMDLVRPAMHPSRNTFPCLWELAEKEHWECYCEALGTALTSAMRKGVEVVATIVGQSHDALLVRITRIRNDSTKKASTHSEDEIPKLHEIPEDLFQKFENHYCGNLYMRRFVLNFRDGDIFILKPRQRRFWLTSSAHADADRILDEALSREVVPSREAL